MGRCHCKLLRRTCCLAGVLRHELQGVGIQGLLLSAVPGVVLHGPYRRPEPVQPLRNGSGS